MAKRHWEFDLDDGHHVVDFKHAYFLGTRTFVVDGAKTVQRAVPFQDHSGEYSFPLPGHDARVRITSGLSYSYDLVVDGLAVGSESVRQIARPKAGSPAYSRTVGILLLVIAIPFSAFVVKGAYDEYRYHTEAATASGIVQAKRTVSGRYGPTYYLTFVFVDGSGVSHTNQGDVERATYDQARPGSRYTIQYLPDEPSMSRVLGKDDTVWIAGLLALGVGMTGLAGFMAVSGHRRMGALARIAIAGQPVTATVTKVKNGNLPRVGKIATVEYVYDDPFGRRRKGRGPLMYRSEAAKYTVGGSVRVMIDPDRPGDSVLP